MRSFFLFLVVACASLALLAAAPLPAAANPPATYVYYGDPAYAYPPGVAYYPPTYPTYYYPAPVVTYPTVGYSYYTTGYYPAAYPVRYVRRPAYYGYYSYPRRVYYPYRR